MAQDAVQPVGAAGRRPRQGALYTGRPQVAHFGALLAGQQVPQGEPEALSAILSGFGFGFVQERGFQGQGQGQGHRSDRCGLRRARRKGARGCAIRQIQPDFVFDRHVAEHAECQAGAV